MDFHQNTVPEMDKDNQNNINNTTNGSTQYNLPTENTAQNANDVSGQAQMPYGNSSQSPYQVQPPYGNNPQSQYQAQPPYGNNNGYYYNNNGYNPYYGRYSYPVNVTEPGSKLASAAMVLGIISLISCFTFTIYPAFITGSIAIVLALLSKGRRPKLFGKARTGIICAVAGLITNTVLITCCIVMIFTNDEIRAQVNHTFEEQYGQTFDEMLEEILEDSGYTD